MAEFGKMPRSNRRLRRRPSTPDLHSQIFTANPASPPETPTTSPHLARKISLKPRHQPPFNAFTASLANDPNIKPVGNHQFSYQPTLRPEQLSPRSSSSEGDASEGVEDSADDESSESASVASLPNAPSAKPYIDGYFHRRLPPRASLAHSQNYHGEEEDEEDDDSDDNDEEVDEEEEEDDDDEDDDDDDVGDGDDNDESSEKQQSRHEQGRYNIQENEESGSENGSDENQIPQPPRIFVTEAATTGFDLILEELDPMDSDWDDVEVHHPYEIESAHSRSGSLHHKDIDRTIMRGMKNLDCSAEPSDNEADFDLEEEVFLQRQQELRRFRRVSMSSSVGKRSYSELSDSEDDLGPLDVNDVGSSARRMRKRLHRSSILFNDPPEQIEELDEPNSSEDEHDELARELPYWTMEIMEVDSS